VAVTCTPPSPDKMRCSDDAPASARWLQETVDWGFPCYPMFSTDTFLDPVRPSDPVREVLARLKSQWEGYRKALE